MCLCTTFLHSLALLMLGDANLAWNIEPLQVAQLHAEAWVHMLAFAIRNYNLLAARTHSYVQFYLYVFAVECVAIVFNFLLVLLLFCCVCVIVLRNIASMPLPLHNASSICVCSSLSAKRIFFLLSKICPPTNARNACVCSPFCVWACHRVVHIPISASSICCTSSVVLRGATRRTSFLWTLLFYARPSTFCLRRCIFYAFTIPVFSHWYVRSLSLPLLSSLYIHMFLLHKLAYLRHVACHTNECWNINFENSSDLFKFIMILCLYFVPWSHRHVPVCVAVLEILYGQLMWDVIVVFQTIRNNFHMTMLIFIGCSKVFLFILLFYFSISQNFYLNILKCLN